MCEYKAERNCTWTAESSRMKGSVQLGLLCLSLLISSLHGEVETESSKQILPPNFEEPDLHQPEIHRVRRETVFTEEEDTAKTKAVVPLSDVKIKRGKRRRVGAFTPLNDNTYSEVYRTKRQTKSKNKKKNRLGYNSLIASVFQLPQQTARAKRDEGAGRKRPWPGS